MDDARRHASPTDSSGRVIEADPADIVIRPLASLAEYQACVALQAAVWGPAYEETVPASLLQVVQHVGGVAIGAFAATGALVGFVFGLTGVDKGEIVHWSHALGVREAVRNRGIGRMLKEHQRATLAQRGIASMYWTFDPLVAKNAHLNLNKLGATVYRPKGSAATLPVLIDVHGGAGSAGDRDGDKLYWSELAKSGPVRG